MTEIPSEQRLVQSIIDHLSLLFNERIISEDSKRTDDIDDPMIANLANPDYGLPDMSEIYIEPSKAKRIEKLRFAIEEVVIKFEPRLKNVHVDYENLPATDYRMRFLLSADIIAKESIQFPAPKGLLL